MSDATTTEQCFFPSQLALYLSGQRGQLAETVVHSHLVTCQGCRTSVERLEWLLAVIRSNASEREHPFPPDTHDLWGELHAWLWPAPDRPMQAARILDLEAELAQVKAIERDLFEAAASQADGA